MSRFREDDRFKAVGPDSIVLAYPTLPLSSTTNSNNRDEAEIWFDWAFVDFWKSNFCKIQLDSWYSVDLNLPSDTVQRGFSTEPDQSSLSSSGELFTIHISFGTDVLRIKGKTQSPQCL